MQTASALSWRFVAGYRKHYYDAKEAASTHTLQMLASLGHTKIFKQALALHMGKINLQTALVGHTPIITAASAGHVEITSHLLRHGADPLIANWYGNALHRAAEANKASTITVLLEAGVDPDTSTTDGATPLGCTADNDAADAAAVLLSHVVDSMDFDSKRDKNLLFAAVEDHCPRLVSLILSRRRVDSEAEGGYFGLTALRTATLILDVELILLLVEATADAAEADFSRRVAGIVQRLPTARRDDIGMQLWEVHKRREG